MSADQKNSWIDNVIRDVAELPDRTSPDDWPDAMLVTGDELREILEARAPAGPSRIRYAGYHGPMDDAECQRILRSDFYSAGDAIVVWINEGDILRHGILLNESASTHDVSGGTKP